jgi:hypothetical protein
LDGSKVYVVRFTSLSRLLFGGTGVFGRKVDTTPQRQRFVRDAEFGFDKGCGALAFSRIACHTMLAIRSSHL